MVVSQAYMIPLFVCFYILYSGCGKWIREGWRLFPPEFVWAEVERLLTLSYSYQKDKVINLYCNKCYAECDKYAGMMQKNKKAHTYRDSEDW